MADGPVLKETVTIMLQASASQPVFANILTISSHHPFTVIDEGPLPEEILQATREVPEYQGYLSRLRYVSKSVGAFLDALFASSMGDRSLVVLLGELVSVPRRCGIMSLG